MLPLGDPRWSSLEGGNHLPYDASEALGRLERGEEVWDELWENLHHQGDVGTASYASVPHLVRIAGARTSHDYHFYGLPAIIEVERHHERNPPLPDDLADAYHAAWRDLLELALADARTVDDNQTLRLILGVIALARGDSKAGAMLTLVDESELDYFLDESDEGELDPAPGADEDSD